MESEDTLLFSKRPTAGPYSEPVQSVYTLTLCLSKIQFNITLPSMPSFPNWSLTSQL